MNISDSEKLIDAFKQANKNLRTRIIQVGVLTILAIGFLYLENQRMKSVTALMNYQSKLEKVNELSDSVFKRVVDNDGDEYFHVLFSDGVELERLALFYKIRHNNYDRKIFNDAIFQIENRIDEINTDKSVSLLGIEIPVEPIFWISFLIMLVLFHDFTQVILYRKKIYRKIHELNIPDWQLGFELFGFFDTSNTTSASFVRFTSSFIVGLMILCPSITSLMMLKLPVRHSDEILSFINVLFMILILADTIIILYAENVWGFRTSSDLFLGKTSSKRIKTKSIWRITTGSVCFFYLLGAIDNSNYSIAFRMLFFVLCVAPIVLLYISLQKVELNGNLTWKAVRAAMLIVNICWFAHVVLMDSQRKYTIEDFEYIIESMIILIGASSIVSVLYIKYFYRE